MPAQNNDPEEFVRLVQEQGAQWRPGHTSVSHLDTGAKSLRLGARIEQVRELANRASAERPTARAGAYPAQFDWRNVNGQNYVTPIRDQSSCGSCVAFGTIGAIEATYQVYRGQPDSGIDLSEAQLFYCIGPSTGASCENGWWPDDAFKGAMAEGLVDEACFPYTPGDQACNLCADAENRKTYITGWHTVTDAGEIKDWVANYGPVSTCFTVYNDFFYYTGGIYRHVSNDVAGGHCVCIVGYDDTNQCWIAKNQWGTGWGEAGYFRIAYGDSDFASQAWTVDGISNTGSYSGVYALGVFSYAAENDAWVYCDQGLGWLQVTSDSTQECVTMFNQLIGSKMSGRPCDLQVTNGAITTVYAW